jgi:hypothetical protein
MFHAVKVGWRVLRLSLRVDFHDGLQTIAYSAFLCFTTILMCPVGFVLLPVTRRIAKVRWSHIFRIGLYAMVILIIPLGVDCYDQIRQEFASYQWSAEIAVTLLIVTSILLAFWWSAATRNYLRIRHAWAVGLFVIVFAHLFQRLVFEAIDLILTLAT